MCGLCDIFIGRVGVEAASLNLSFHSDSDTWEVRVRGVGMEGELEKPS